MNRGGVSLNVLGEKLENGEFFIPAGSVTGLTPPNWWLLGAISAFDFVNNRYMKNGGAQVSFSDVLTLTRSGAGNIWNSDGEIESVATDNPRFTYDPDTDTQLGILIEAGLTNRVYDSDDLSGLTPVNMTIDSEGHDNYGTVFTFTDSNDGAPAIHRVNFPGFTQTSGYFGFRWLRAKAGTKKYLCVASTTIEDLIGVSSREYTAAIFDVDAGTVVYEGAYVDAVIVPDVDGFFFCGLRDTSANSTTGNNRGYSIRLSNGETIADTSYQGDGTGTMQIVFPGADEQASVAFSSRIPISILQTTSTSNVTRGIETLFASNLVGVLDSRRRKLSGVVYARTPAVAQQASSYTPVFQVDDGTTGNVFRLEWYNNAGTLQLRLVVTTGNVAQTAPLVIGTVAADTDFRVSFRAEDNDIFVSLDGAEGVTDTSATMPSGLATLRIGATIGNTYRWNSTIKNIQFFPTKGDDELKALSAAA